MGHESFSAYGKASVTLADKNVVPGSYALIKSAISMRVHRGTTQAQNQALMLGMEANLAAIGYVRVTASQTVDALKPAMRHLVVLVNDDDTTERFTISARPSVRTRFEETAHIKLLLIALMDPAPGLP